MKNTNRQLLDYLLVISVLNVYVKATSTNHFQINNCHVCKPPYCKAFVYKVIGYQHPHMVTYLYVVPT